MSSLEILKNIVELLAVNRFRVPRIEVQCFHLTKIQILNVVLEHFTLVFCFCSWFLAFSFCSVV